MGQLIDGKFIAKELNSKTAARVAELKQNGVTPKLAVILVGDDRPSRVYVRKKGETAESVGIDFALHTLSALTTTADVLATIDTIQVDPPLSGVIVQLPLPEHINTQAILNRIRPEVDVDCLTDINLGRLVMKTHTILPPTPGAVMSILETLDVELIGKNVTIIGVGPLVGKPLAIMMMNARASVTTCNSKTKDTKAKCLAADIIITGVGKKDTLRGDMVRPGTIVIDTGVDFAAGVMFGDVNVPEVVAIAAHVTPTPGGVGPITVARLLMNTAICAENRKHLCPQ
ncbi:MAG: bifunctional 5,10-methylenetetrahydrofolate dehydrogenase/5,10-methenyltetrahydrofolate cyclohydrolase [Candidatus Magasanikbacteria bacterium]|nr:bifunctional 5,10-methylenetetrahydrofolate dehydrogenase/5,10-methenyltetrahydrofolate cyclohydrolase [Candidatus Magasanikbacteria bacterium]